MYEYLNTLLYLRISVFWGRHLHSEIIPKGAGIRSFSSVIGLSHNLSFHTFYASALHLPLIRPTVEYEYCNIFTRYIRGCPYITSAAITRQGHSECLQTLT